MAASASSRVRRPALACWKSFRSTPKAPACARSTRVAIADPVSAAQLDAMERNASEFGVVRRFPRTTKQAFPIDCAESALGIDGPPEPHITGWRALWRDLLAYLRGPSPWQLEGDT